MILDRTVFQLNEQTFEQFNRLLEQPTTDNPGLDKLLNTKAVWE
ncbi:DUF1778 domain-containing protein [Actinobacillus arthritidis]|nr:DUF1778 domain-containing protein [Actinobacillus arthritidis]WGE89231.1 DUF1778 domain-containing protein [Actinobacillus arthritidis]